VNGGRNYNNRCSSVNKIWLYAGKPEYPKSTQMSDNLLGADNQQERLLVNKIKISIMLNISQIPLQIGYYLAGFVDGEGSFHVSFRPRDDYQML